jgi:hypothetical protein
MRKLFRINHDAIFQKLTCGGRDRPQHTFLSSDNRKSESRFFIPV